MAGVVGFEPTDGGFRVLCLTTWLHPNIQLDLNDFSIFHPFPQAPLVIDKSSRLVYTSSHDGSLV